jgi:hypothetical protein
MAGNNASVCFIKEEEEKADTTTDQHRFFHRS